MAVTGLRGGEGLDGPGQDDLHFRSNKSAVARMQIVAAGLHQTDTRSRRAAEAPAFVRAFALSAGSFRFNVRG